MEYTLTFTKEFINEYSINAKMVPGNIIRIWKPSLTKDQKEFIENTISNMFKDKIMVCRNEYVKGKEAKLTYHKLNFAKFSDNSEWFHLEAEITRITLNDGGLGDIVCIDKITKEIKPSFSSEFISKDKFVKMFLDALSEAKRVIT